MKRILNLRDAVRGLVENVKALASKCLANLSHR